RFVCVIAAARGGRVLASFRGEAQGTILGEPRGGGGFGYDPLFLAPGLGKTFAELSVEEKAAVSHRGQAFRKFLEWYARR
ncbi:MAG: non-canonical purine NTP pyrophosphatase, partial [Nevskiales bacterium]